eukprot:853588-Rhodomonas_salina.7
MRRHPCQPEARSSRSRDSGRKGFFSNGNNVRNGVRGPCFQCPPEAQPDHARCKCTAQSDPFGLNPRNIIRASMASPQVAQASPATARPSKSPTTSGYLDHLRDSSRGRSNQPNLQADVVTQRVTSPPREPSLEPRETLNFDATVVAHPSKHHATAFEISISGVEGQSNRASIYKTYAQCEELQRRLIEKFLPLPKKKAKSNPMADKSPIVEMNRSESLEFLTASCGPQHARTNENPSKD